MRAHAAVLLLLAAPTGPATKLIAIWMDHGAPYMELRPDGSGRIGALENTWTVDKDQLHVVQKDSGDAFDIPFTLQENGKQLKLLVQGTTVLLERSKKNPAATAPPPPKPPSALDAKDPPDAGSAKKKKKGKK
jgi:hypothetical protein